MQYGIAFTPLVPTIVLWIALAAIVVIAALLLLGRSRGAAVRVALAARLEGWIVCRTPSFEARPAVQVHRKARTSG